MIDENKVNKIFNAFMQSNLIDMFKKCSEHKSHNYNDVFLKRMIELLQQK